MIDSSHDKLNIVLKRQETSHTDESSLEATARYPNQFNTSYKEEIFSNDVTNSRSNWSNQNVYVQPPTRGETTCPLATRRITFLFAGDFARMLNPVEENKSNIARLHQHLMQNGSGSRHRGPITDISFPQLDTQQQQAQSGTPINSVIAQSVPSTPGTLNGMNNCIDNSPAPPRPPPPRAPNPNATPSKSPYLDHHQNGDGSPSLLPLRRPPSFEPRLISFKKEGSLGIRLTGGNEVGIFVSAVQAGSAASLQGLQSGDKILKVNHTDMRGMTREEAVLYLLGVQDQIDLIVQYRKEEFDEIVAKQKGDSFHIRTHFKYDGSSKGELDFQSGELFHVVDTLHNDMVGSWLVFRVNRKSEMQKGVIPNRSRAEEAANEQNAEKSSKKEDSAGGLTRGNFFRRRSARRSKILSRDTWEDTFADNIKFPAYERVSLKHPGFIRPVVLFGPLSDIARDKLLKDYPEKYESPLAMDRSHLDEEPSGKSPQAGKASVSGLSTSVVRLSSIRNVIEKGKHALLDINPSAVNRLNYAQFAPIVIFLRAENKSIVKELRSRYSKVNQAKSSRKLYDSSVKLEKMFSHLFTSVITLTSAEMWYKKLRETIEKQQQISIWMSDSKPPESIADDFLFPMASRLSYASSPESDVELADDTKPGKDYSGRLAKASSDPSIATMDDMQSNVYPPPPYNSRAYRDDYDQSMQPKSYLSEKEALDREDYLASMKDAYNSLYQPSYSSDLNVNNVMQNIYGIQSPPSALNNGPEPPPRIDRANKPNRFRGMNEKLFAMSDYHDANDPPDYINTALTQPSPMDTPNSTIKNAPPTLPDHHPAVVNGRVGPFMDNSSFSSDSYKYGSPSDTLDNRRYGSVNSANSTLLVNCNRPQVPEVYRYPRNSVQQPINGYKSMQNDVMQNTSPMSMGKSPMPSDYRPQPPSPPPKPSNYQSL